jgi:hypothetical protein
MLMPDVARPHANSTVSSDAHPTPTEVDGGVPTEVVVVSVVVKTVVVVVSVVVVDPGVLVVVVSVVDHDGVVGAVAGSTTRINPLT